MAKKQHIVEMTGYVAVDTPATVQQGKDVKRFMDNGNHFCIKNINDKSVELVTAKGSYFLWKSKRSNIYMGTAAGVKVHFTKKVIVGKLIYWA